MSNTIPRIGGAVFIRCPASLVLPDGTLVPGVHLHREVDTENQQIHVHTCWLCGGYGQIKVSSAELTRLPPNQFIEALRRQMAAAGAEEEGAN